MSFLPSTMHTTIGEVADEIRNNPGIDLTRCVFVVGPDGSLIGFVPGRNLIVNPPNLPIRQVMQPILHKVSPDASRDEVVEIVERYKIPALPVVDNEDRLWASLTYEDVVELMEDIADETIATWPVQARMSANMSEIFKRFYLRAPWLLVTLLAGLFSATAMAHFYNQFWFAFVPFFVPLITGMSGNVGIQCSTILSEGCLQGIFHPVRVARPFGQKLASVF